MEKKSVTRPSGSKQYTLQPTGLQLRQNLLVDSMRTAPVEFPRIKGWAGIPETSIRASARCSMDDFDFNSASKTI